MANETEGMFIDPRGMLMPLRASTPESFRVLVTRKLEQGWKPAPASPAVEPLRNEDVLALPPLPAPEVAKKFAKAAEVLKKLDEAVAVEDRAAAVVEARAKVSKKDK